MNLYDNYSDLFLLSKLVDAIHTHGRFVWNGAVKRTDDNLNFVSTQIRLHNSIEFLVIDAIKYASATVCCFVVIAQKLYANSRHLIQRKQIHHLFDAHDGLSLIIQ